MKIYYIGFIKDKPGDIAGLLMVPVEVLGNKNDRNTDDRARAALQRKAVEKGGKLIRILKAIEEVSP